jgi:DNA-binding CsgD family transcriptional regulator
MPMDVARVRLDLAQALASESPEVAASEAMAALETFERLEASRLADAAAAVLRSLGGPARTGPKGRNALTKREAEVLELLGLGLSNPEISDRLYITRKTVEHHVGSLLSKLGLRNRAEAAASAARSAAACTSESSWSRRWRGSSGLLVARSVGLRFVIRAWWPTLTPGTASAMSCSRRDSSSTGR